MDQRELVSQLQVLETVPSIKIRQPWASWIFYRGKSEEIRTTPNHYRGLVGVVASGWDSSFNELRTSTQYPYPYDTFCLIGFCYLAGEVTYFDRRGFEATYTRHLNPPDFYRDGCYGWLLQKSTPIEPIYYHHHANQGKALPLIQLKGTRSRGRISVSEIIDHIKVR